MPGIGAELQCCVRSGGSRCLGNGDTDLAGGVVQHGLEGEILGIGGQSQGSLQIGVHIGGSNLNKETADMRCRHASEY